MSAPVRSNRAGTVGVAGVLLIVALSAIATYFATRRFGVADGGEERAVETVAVASRGALVAPAPPPLAEAPVRNVILLIGDGMGEAQIVAGRTHTRGPDGRLHLERLPVTGRVATHPIGTIVTKSDSSATALATGRKTRNGRIGTDADGQPMTSIVETLRAAGWAAGAITTSRITDATPASFVTHVPERRLQNDIAAQLVNSGMELLMGGGLPFFQPSSVKGSAREDGRDLLAEARERGTSVVEDATAYLDASSLPLLAVLPVDPQNDPDRDPAVAALAKKAIELLSATGKPFFLLVEDEEIDSASHANDARRLGEAIERFDAAVTVATGFAASRGDTLVVVTGDHATGGPAIDERSTATEMTIVWESNGHTGEPVPVFAYGPPLAAARFAGTLDNTDIPKRIAVAVGIDFPGAPGVTPAPIATTP